MADDIAVNPTGAGAQNVATDEVAARHYQLIKLAFGADGSATLVDAASGLPVVIVGTVPVSGPLTDAQLRAAAVPVSGPLTDAQLRAAAVPVSGPLTDAQLRAAAVPVSGPLTDAQLRAAAVPVSGSVTTGGLTDGQLRATPVEVAGAALASLVATVQTHDAAAGATPQGQLILAVRKDADTASAGADGDFTFLTVNELGRLKVAGAPAQFTPVTGAITASTQTVAADVTQVSNVMVYVTGAFAGHNSTFEGSIDNGVSWFAVQAVRSNSNTIDLTTGVLGAAPAYAWELSVNALTNFRVRATAHTSGTANWRITLGAYATEPIPAAQVSATQPISGTVTAGLSAGTTRAAFLAAAGIWFDDSATNLGASATFTGTSRDLTVTATATAFANAATYAKELRVGAESDVTGTLWLEVSRDNTNWRRIKSVATAAVAGGGFFAEIIHLPSWRYARVGFTNGAGAQARFSIGSILAAI